MVSERKPPRVLMEILNGIFVCVCFFHRNPFLWCWKLWITITHQNQVKLQLPNPQCESNRESILKYWMCLFECVWLLEPGGFDPKTFDSSTPICRIHRNSSGKKKRKYPLSVLSLGRTKTGGECLWFSSKMQAASSSGRAHQGERYSARCKNRSENVCRQAKNRIKRRWGIHS